MWGNRRFNGLIRILRRVSRKKIAKVTLDEKLYGTSEIRTSNSILVKLRYGKVDININRISKKSKLI